MPLGHGLALTRKDLFIQVMRGKKIEANAKCFFHRQNQWLSQSSDAAWNQGSIRMLSNIH